MTIARVRHLPPSPPATQAARNRTWTLVLISTALFMVVLDNLVVNVALPSIHRDLGSSIQALEWTVSAYVLAYAVFLLTGSALGDRFGRKRMFLFGVSLFTVSSAVAAMAPTSGSLIAARALQGLGAAIATPLTLTLLADAFPPERRGLAIGVWSGISGIAVALGPLVGGAVVQAVSWHWIFWINVPIGVVLVPLSARRLMESHGPSRHLDLPGLGWAWRCWGQAHCSRSRCPSAPPPTRPPTPRLSEPLRHRFAPSSPTPPPERP